VKIRVGVVGIGAMGQGIVQVIQRRSDMEVIAIADKNSNQLKKVEHLLSKGSLITRKPMDIINEELDVLVEASTSVVEAALLIIKALENKINVVLMNSEVDQVFGRLLNKIAKKNCVVLTSDSGDQYGVLRRLIEDISFMGFKVVMAGNNKGFLDRYATPKTIEKEAAIRNLSLNQCTSYTDGTKLAIEMAIIANAMNLNLLKSGMIGPRVDDVNDALNAFDLDKARELGGVVDYILGAKPGGSVFVIAYSDDSDDQFYMNYYKMGNGPYYLFLRPYHLCHFETAQTIDRVIKYKEPVLVQEKRILEVNACVKTNLNSGTKLDGMGGYHLYGILEKPDRLPIGLSKDAVLIRNKKKDEQIYWEDVEFPEGDKRLELWEEQNKLNS